MFCSYPKVDKGLKRFWRRRREKRDVSRVAYGYFINNELMNYKFMKEFNKFLLMKLNFNSIKKVIKMERVKEYVKNQ